MNNNTVKSDIQTSQRYFAGFSIRIGILRSAAVALSILSFLTTYFGFKNTVFDGNWLMAGLASAAIQSILLAGIFFYCPIADMLINVIPNKGSVLKYMKDPNGYKSDRSGNSWDESVRYFVSLVSAIVIVSIIFSLTLYRLNKLFPENDYLSTHFITRFLIYSAVASLIIVVALGCFTEIRKKVWNMVKLWVITFVILFSMTISIMFSCVSITNSLYVTDYARDADPLIEETIRKEILNLNSIIEDDVANRAFASDSGDSEEMNMRNTLIKTLEDSGKDFMKNGTKTKIKNYRKTTEKRQTLERPKMLYSFDVKDTIFNGKSYEVKKGKYKIKINGKTKTRYYWTESGYAEAFWGIDYSKGRGAKWVSDTDKIINTVNHEMYIRYLGYYYRYKKLLNSFNNISKADYNTLDKVKSIRLSLMVLHDEICLDSQKEKWENEHEKPKKRERVVPAEGEDQTFLTDLEAIIDNGGNKEKKSKYLSTTKAKITDEAITVSLALRTELEGFIQEIDSFLVTIYGVSDPLSIREMQEVIGLSQPSLEESDHVQIDGTPISDIELLEKAANQFRSMQGDIIANAKDDEERIKAENILANLNAYVELMSAKARLDVLAENVNANYIIDKDSEKIVDEIEDEDKVESAIGFVFKIFNIKNSSSQTETESIMETGIEQSSEAESDLSDESEETTDSESETDSISDTEEYVESLPSSSIIEISQWKNYRNTQLNELKSIITTISEIQDSLTPIVETEKSDSQTKAGGVIKKDKVVTPESEEEINWNSNIDDNLDKQIEIIDDMIHMYLQASELEITYNLVYNSKTNRIIDRDYFVYRGKAHLALAISIFSDFGAALIGVLIYFLDPKELERRLFGYSKMLQKDKQARN